MYRKKICGMDFDIVQYGDILNAGIKEQRNQAAKFIYERYMDIYKAVMHVVNLGLVALLEEGYTLEYFRLKTIFDLIDERVKSVKLSLTSVKDGDEIRPEHVNELYEPFPELSRHIMFAIMMARAITLGLIDSIITNMDDLIECVRTYFYVKVKHLDIIQSEHWNRILDMLEVCCVSPIIVEEDADELKKKLRKREKDFNRIMDEVTDEVVEAIRRCLEQNECDEMNSIIHTWIMDNALPNAIRLINYYGEIEFEELIKKYIVTIKTSAAFAMYMYKYNKYPDNIADKFSETLNMQVNKVIVDTINESIELANDVTINLLAGGEYKGNEAFSSLSIYCLGEIYFGAILGANNWYYYEPISCFDAERILENYGLAEYIDPCSAYRVFAIKTIVNELDLMEHYTTALVLVYAGNNYTRVSLIAFGQYIMGNLAFCFRPRGAEMVCVNTMVDPTRPVYVDVYVDRYGNMQVAGPTESEIIIAP